MAALVAVAVIGLLTAPGAGLRAWGGGDGEPGRDLTVTSFGPPCLADRCPQEPGLSHYLGDAFLSVQPAEAVFDAGGAAGFSGIVVAPVALLAGVGAALLLLGHARRRLGGVTGDVLGALVETAGATTLAVYAILG
nr:adenosylcobinamide-GDP ribazoletransferase [Nonomuraea candida]